MPISVTIIMAMALVFKFSIIVWCAWLVPYLSPMVFAMAERAR